MDRVNISNLAPICLFVYNRIESVKTCLKSLERNEYFFESPLFIFSDGPKSGSTKKDLAKIEKVRKFIHSKDWTVNTVIIESKQNKGLANSVISGVSHVLTLYNKVIVLEDDLVFSSDFLSYINNSLLIYNERLEVFSISAYIFPIKIPGDYTHQVIALPAISSYGWATWKDRWELAEWDLTQFYSNIISDKAKNLKFKIAGEQMISLLKKQHYQLIDSWAIRWYHAMNSNNGLSIFPIKCKAIQVESLSNGTHKTNKNKMNLELSEIPIILNKDIKVDDRILSEVQSFFKVDLFRRIYYFFLFLKSKH